MADNKTKVIWNYKKGRHEKSDTGTFMSEGREARDLTLGDLEKFIEIGKWNDPLAESQKLQ